MQVSHPKKTRYIAEARIKCDRVDSRAIAELVRLDALPLSYVPPEEIAKLREKVRRRAFLVQEIQAHDEDKQHASIRRHKASKAVWLIHKARHCLVP